MFPSRARPCPHQGARRATRRVLVTMCDAQWTMVTLSASLYSRLGPGEVHLGVSILMLLTFMTIHLFQFPFQFKAVFTVCAGVEPNTAPQLVCVSVHFFWSNAKMPTMLSESAHGSWETSLKFALCYAVLRLAPHRGALCEGLQFIRVLTLRALSKVLSSSPRDIRTGVKPPRTKSPSR